MDATVATPMGPGRRNLDRNSDRAPGKEFSDILKELETWYQSANGEYLLTQLRAQLAGELDTAFGYHLAQVGVTRCHPLYADSLIRHRVYVAPTAGELTTLVAQADELPLETDSVDVLIAHHSLEFCDNPHQALREMHRVLTPQGHLFIIGFNPASLPGVGMSLRARFGSPLWSARRGLFGWRLADWLNVLGMEVETQSQHYALPLFGRGRLRRAIAAINDTLARSGLPVGGVYLIHAMKQVPGQARPLPSRRARLIDLAVPKPVPTPQSVPQSCKRSCKRENAA